jgi:hypothetical protein
MTQPSWRQLAAIPESKLKAQILSACGIEPEVAGVCHIFHAGDIQIYASDPPKKKSLCLFKKNLYYYMLFKRLFFKKAIIKSVSVHVPKWALKAWVSPTQSSTHICY